MLDLKYTAMFVALHNQAFADIIKTALQKNLLAYLLKLTTVSLNNDNLILPIKNITII